MAAIQGGLKVARGDCVGMISADLQDPHELFVEMVDHWRRGIKAVLAVRQDREETATQRWFANTHYRLLRRFAVPDYPKGGFDFCLIDRQVVNEINAMAEKNTHIMTLIFWLGFSPVLIPYTRRKRSRGKSRWTLQKKFKLFVDSFVAFSYVPIRFLSVVGLLTSFLAIAYAAFQVVAKLVYGTPVPGFSTTVVLIALTSGVQMIMLGVLGEYLWRILDETRRRPMYVVDRIYGRPQPPPPSE
jgi:dolichol-phosphate mannosyltransferase